MNSAAITSLNDKTEQNSGIIVHFGIVSSFDRHPFSPNDIANAPNLFAAKNDLEAVQVNYFNSSEDIESARPYGDRRK
jgi:hypothetical protein